MGTQIAGNPQPSLSQSSVVASIPTSSEKVFHPGLLGGMLVLAVAVSLHAKMPSEREHAAMLARAIFGTLGPVLPGLSIAYACSLNSGHRTSESRGRIPNRLYQDPVDEASCARHQYEIARRL